MDFVSAAKHAGFTLDHFMTVGSTNDLAMDHLRRGGASRHFIVAREQEGGRGRLGRKWVSEAGNLYASLALIDPAPQAQSFQLGFVAALAIRSALIKIGVAPSKLSLKWPNDVLLNGQKISGILIEGTRLSETHIGVVIGCGINVALHPSDTPYRATDLHEAGHSASVEDVFAALASAFDDGLKIYQKGANFAALRDEWLRQAHGLAGPITVRDRNSELNGIFSGLDEDGRLLVAHAGVISAVVAGDVFFQAEGKK